MGSGNIILREIDVQLVLTEIHYNGVGIYTIALIVG
jgi:hypothetical protein